MPINSPRKNSEAIAEEAIRLLNGNPQPGRLPSKKKLDKAQKLLADATYDLTELTNIARSGTQSATDQPTWGSLMVKTEASVTVVKRIVDDVCEDKTAYWLQLLESRIRSALARDAITLAKIKGKSLSGKARKDAREYIREDRNSYPETDFPSLSGIYRVVRMGEAEQKRYASGRSRLFWGMRRRTTAENKALQFARYVRNLWASRKARRLLSIEVDLLILLLAYENNEKFSLTELPGKPINHHTTNREGCYLDFCRECGRFYHWWRHGPRRQVCSDVCRARSSRESRKAQAGEKVIRLKRSNVIR